MIVSVQQTISMGHRLPSYDGICSSPHGHNIRVDVGVHVSGDTFLDFKEVSRELGAILVDLDHAMLLYAEDPLVEALKPFNFRVFKLSVEPTTEALAQLIFNAMSTVYHTQAKHIVSVTVYETDRYRAICEKSSQQVWRVE